MPSSATLSTCDGYRCDAAALIVDGDPVHLDAFEHPLPNQDGHLIVVE